MDLNLLFGLLFAASMAIIVIPAYKYRRWNASKSVRGIPKSDVLQTDLEEVFGI